MQSHPTERNTQLQAYILNGASTFFTSEVH